MIVCIAEKPSVGRDIADVLGAHERHEGYIEGNGYQVTWAFGHLCGLLEPQEYTEQWKYWSMNTLPMIPEPFRIKVTGDAGVQKQFDTIKNLVSQADMVVNCGDAGQEGELIQRWILQKAGCKCPVKRLWISSLTVEAIKDGFANLEDQIKYQKLYEAGLMRAIGDWMLGMNATRAFTLKYRTDKKGVLSVGRVQTPTLALIVNRDREIANFKPRTYWELKTTYRDTLFNAIIRKQDDELIDEIQKAQEVAEKSKKKEVKIPTLDELQAKNIGIDPIASVDEGNSLIERLKDQPLTITSIEKKKGTEAPPRLFDLTSLQVECNKKFAMSAEDTLNTIQSLYEKKITTYPRVDTTYLTDDLYPKMPNTLMGIRDYYPELIDALGGKQLPKSKKVFDNSKVTDHHAIIPTGQKPNNLTDLERQVFDLIARRFIAVFYPDCQFATTTVMADVDGIPFKATGRQQLDAGWKIVFQKAAVQTDDDSEEQKDEKTLPEFKKGESGPHTPQLVEKQTTPPKPYTEATLLRAMETAGKTVDDEELRDAMKENGIGRPSTRASIIETLFKRGYIVKKGKSLYSTDIGRNLISVITVDLLKSAELTGRWERKLRLIERGNYEPKDFMTELKQMVNNVVWEVKADMTGQICPVCRQGRLIRGHHAYGCSRWREGCNYRVPFTENPYINA